MPRWASRLVSRHDPDARPIRTGRIGHPVEFGDKAQVLDNPDGIVLDHQVMVANPPERRCWPRRRAGHRRHRPGARCRGGRPGRGHGAAVDQELADLGVAWVAIPRRGRTGPTRRAVEHRRGFGRLVKGRTGCEGRISCLKHRLGWDRTLLDGIDGARIWCGHGVFAHNLVKLAGLLQARHNRPA